MKHTKKGHIKTAAMRRNIKTRNFQRTALLPPPSGHRRAEFSSPTKEWMSEAQVKELRATHDLSDGSS